MAFTTLEKALLTYIGVEKIAPGTTKRALVAAVKKLPGIAAPVARTAAFTPAGRTVAGAAGIAAAYQAGLLDRPLEAIQMDEPIGPFGSEVKFQAPLDLPGVVKKAKRKVSKFSKAVGAGMKVAKASTSYGSKGKLSSPKKAFLTVTKVASAINKGKKPAKSGIRRKLGLAIRKILK